MPSPRIIAVEETGSTNADLMALAIAGKAAEGDWLIAETQTAGRGRRDRHWQSPKGNFYGSTLVSLRPSDPPAASLALVAGVGLFLAVGDPAQLKWPNDLTIRGAKVGGILLERHKDHVVIGFGVNVAVAPDVEGRTTACLAIDGNGIASVEEMLASLVEWVPWAVAFWRKQGLLAICGRWEQEAHMRGTLLRVTIGVGKPLEGSFDGLADDGALRLRLADGRVEIIHAADVELLGER